MSYINGYFTIYSSLKCYMKNLLCRVFSTQSRRIKEFQLDKPVKMKMKCAFCNYRMNYPA